MCEFVEIPLCTCSSFCARFDDISVTQHTLDFYQIFFGRHKFWSPSKWCLRAHSIMDKSHLQKSWAQGQMQHGTLQHTSASRRVCLVSSSKCVHPISPFQNWRLSVSRSPPQSLQESASTYAFFLLTLIVNRSHQLCHIHIFGLQDTLCIVYLLSK